MTFHVDTFYVNIGIGDCALHLLINDDDNTIEKLMVVDTGDSKSARFVGKYCRPQHILQTWSRIRTYYAHVPEEPQIDVLVITHLDSDHWGACRELVGSQIGFQVTDDMNNDQIAALRMKWFKYHNGVPLTEVVAPQPLTTPFGMDAAPQNAGCESFLKFFWEATDGSGRNAWVTNMARFRSRAVWLLGLNLFNIANGCIPWSEKATITSPAKLLAENPPIANQPGAYIICAEWQMLGETGTAPIGSHNVRNRTSIGAMIMWNTNPVRMSHYFAGDLEAPKEILIAKWIMGRPLSEPIVDSDLGPVRVTSMKASHHGASSSTPMEMLLVFNPHRIIFSCGTKHGHPRWETIFNLYGWLLLHSQDFIQSRPVYSTRHPYWIIRDELGNIIDQQTALTWFTNASDNSQHIKWLEQMYMASHNADKNPWVIFKNQRNNLNTVTARNLLFSMAGELFDNMSNVKKDAVDIIANAYNNSQWTTQIKGEEVEFVVVCSANDDRDGQIDLLARFIQKEIQVEQEGGFDGGVHIHIPMLEEETSQDQGSELVEEIFPNVSIPLQTSQFEEQGVGQEHHFWDDQVITMPELSVLEATSKALEAAEPVLSTSAIATEVQTSAPASSSLPVLSMAPTKGEPFIRYGRQAFVPYWASRANSTSMSDIKPNTVVAKQGTYTVAPGTDPNEIDPNDLLPEPPFVVPTPDPTPPINPPVNVFLLLSSKLLASGAERIHVYSEARVDNFIDALHSGAIAFQNPLSTDKASSILDTDEWYGWLQLAFGKIEKFSASLDKDRTISEIAFALSAGYQFTTRSANTALNGSILSPLKPTVTSAQMTHLGQSIAPDGLLEAQNMLILGLDAKAPQIFATLSNVVNFLGLSYLSKSLVMKCIGSLNLALAPVGRNAMWFAPEQGYKTSMRLEFGLAPPPSAPGVAYLGLDAVKELLKFLRVGVTDVSIIAKADKRWTGTSQGMAALNKSELVLLANCTIPQSSFLTILEFRKDSIILTARINEAGFLKAFVDWLLGLLEIETFDFNSWINSVGQYINLAELRRVTLQLSLNTTGPDAGKVSGIQSVSLDMEATWKGSETDILFLLTYDWSSGGISRLRGSLWNKPPDDLILTYAPLLPEWEEYNLLFPLNQAAYNASLDLKKVWPDLSNIPQGLPTLVTQAGIDISSEGFRFSGVITCDKVGTDQGAPRISLGKVALDAGYLLPPPTSPKGSKGSWYLGVVADIGLLPQPGSKYKLPAQLRGVLLYDSGSKSWSLTGSAMDLRMAHLASYFDQDSISPVMEVMDDIEIKYLELTYNIQPKEAGGNSFTFTGIILFGALELDLFFTYQRAGWTFNARLVPPTMISGPSSTTIGQLYKSVTGSEPDLLPSFLSDITVTRPDADRNAIGISCAKTSQQAIFFAAYARIVGLGLAFVQYKPAAKSGSTKEAVSTKRIIKTSLSQFPTLKVPLIGDLPQLFEEAYFLWVQDTSQVADASLKGITRAELADINSVVINPELNLTSDSNTSSSQASNQAADPASKQVVTTVTTQDTDPTTSASSQKSTKTDASFTMKLLFKEPKKPPKPTAGDTKPKGDPNDIVIQAGWHFVVVVKTADGGSEVAIDYVFGAKEETEKQTAAANDPAKPEDAPSSDAKTSGDHKSLADNKTPADDKTAGSDKPQAQGSGDVKKDPFKKTIGPLSISNLGFSYAKETLSIIVDATLELGPVELSLLGFQISIHFDQGITLQNLPSPDKFQIDLAGLAVGFNKAPITIAGRFLHTSTAAQEFFAGGVVVAFQPWMFQAAGFYADNKATEKVPAYKSVFVFAKLTGPLITFGFAEISGITGAFGYNVQLRLPSVSEVKTFPFVASQDSQSPETALANLVGGDDAWAVPSLGSMWLAAGLKVTAFQVLAIDAVIVIQWAPVVKLGIFGVGVCDVPNSKADKKFAHVELGLLCTVDPSAGVFKVEAQLSPNSYILDPSCHLTGGFALYSWWKPDQPQVEGQAGDQNDGDWVFTIGGYHPAFKPPPQYPKVDRLKISWSLDDSLSITGEAYFAVTPKVCMGGGKLHAALSLGPLRAWFDAYVDFLINYQPFYFMGDGGLSVGVAFDLDLWLVTIHIQVEIGATLHIEGPPVAGFVHVNFWVFGFDVKFGTPAKKPDVRTLDEFYGLLLQSSTGSSNASKPHVYSCVRGLVSPNSTTAPTSDDPWRVTGGILQIAISCKVAFYTVIINGKLTPELGDDTPLYGKPMQLTDRLTKSELTITINHPGSDEPEWQFSKTSTALPRALWEKYDENDDPLITSQLSNLFASTDVSMSLTNGLRIHAPEPEVSLRNFAKFNAVKADVESVYDPDEKKPETQAYTVVNSAWDPANQPESERWTLVKDAWTKAPEAASNRIVDVWREALGWAVPTVVDPMDGKKPSLLLNDFDNLYIKPPLILALS